MSDLLEAEIRKYSQQLAVDPKSRAFVPLADAYRKLGRYDEAIQVAQDGLNQHPHYVAGKMALARAQFENGDLTSARDLLEAVVRTSPDNLLAIRILSEIHVQNGEGSRAIPLLKQLLAMEPNDAKAKEQLASLEKPSEPQAASEPEPVSSPETSATAVPESMNSPLPSATTTPTLAELYASQGHVNEALKVYEDLSKVRPSPGYSAKVEELKGKLGGVGANRADLLNGLMRRIQERRRST